MVDNSENILVEFDYQNIVAGISAIIFAGDTAHSVA
jgi:hypothetical protein